MGFSRQEYWSRLPCPPPGDLPDPRIEPTSLVPPALAVCSSLLVPRGGSGGKVAAYDAGDLGLIPGSGRTTGEGNGNPLQYSCPGNPMDKEAWWATLQEVTESQTQLSN